MSITPIRYILFSLLTSCMILCIIRSKVAAEPQSSQDRSTTQPKTTNSPARQAKLESELAKMLSGATLEGSFTRTGAGGDGTKFSREKYTLGEVKKIAGEVWQIPARIQYGDKDVTLPIMLPIRWAGDTPVVVVDELPLPGFGAVSARVMFFDGHYAGYWKHGDHSGNLFGVIHSVEAKPTASNATPSLPADSAPPSRIRAKAAGDK